MREGRIDCYVGHIEDVDVGDFEDLDRHSEGAGCKIFPPDFEQLISHVIITDIVFDPIS